MSLIEVEFKKAMQALSVDLEDIHALILQLNRSCQDSSESLIFINFLISSLGLVLAKSKGSNTHQIKQELKRSREYFGKLEKKKLAVDKNAVGRMVKAGLLRKY
jgi:hypothetical protein